MPAQFLPVTHIPQIDPAGCLAACAQMVLNYFGQSFSQEQLNRLFDLTIGGVPLSRLQRLQQQNIHVSIQQGDEFSLFHALDNRVPPIVFVDTTDLAYWHESNWHAVVVVGYDDGQLFLNDPAFPQAPQTVSVDEFMLAWSEFDYTHALITLG